MKPGEHKTVQARILKYAQDVGWTFVSRPEAEERRADFPVRQSRQDAGRNARAPLSLFFDDLLDAKVRKFNPRYTETKGDLISRFGNFRTNIYGNREFVDYLRNRGKFFDQEENRERDLILIDYDNPERNVYEVTEEWAFHNGHYGTREDVVFLINGIPVLVIECKNATKDEAIGLGIDQVRRYHCETPELLVPEQVFTATDAIGFSYGVTWNLVRRNIFNWKLTESGFSSPLPERFGGLESPPSVEESHADWKVRPPLRKDMAGWKTRPPFCLPISILMVRSRGLRIVCPTGNRAMRGFLSRGDWLIRCQGRNWISGRRSGISGANAIPNHGMI